MPLSINVGLSRKASKDYQSTGVSINVTAELDQSLLARPDELQQQINNLYAQAEQALDRQAGTPDEPQQTQAASRYKRSNGNTNGNGNGHARNGGGMTDSQRRAITAIARRIGVDPAQEAQDILGVELDSLSLKDASALIDHLKSLQPAGGRNGRS